MSGASLYAKHSDLAPKMAARFPHVPGADRDDVLQEARAALWVAASTHDHERGPFRQFASTVIWHQLATLLKAATREKRTAAVVHDGFVTLAGGVEPDRVVVARETLERLTAAIDALSEFERRSLIQALNDVPRDRSGRQAVNRARRKLRAAA